LFLYVSPSRPSTPTRPAAIRYDPDSESRAVAIRLATDRVIAHGRTGQPKKLEDIHEELQH
jgi:hypothetical protein